MPSLPDISLRQLEYLIAVVEADTWSEAAAAMGVSASALSQGLAELERRIEVPLFEPDGRRRRLREEAVPTLAHARQVVALTTDLLRWAKEVEGGRRGSVRVGMIDVAATVHYPDVVRAFRTGRPDVEFHLTVAPSGQLIDQLRAGDLDVIVGVAPGGPVSGIETEPLTTEPMHVIAPCGVVVGPPPEWGPWLTFPAGSHTRDQVLSELARRGAATHVAAESHQPDVLVEMVRMGLGWTVLPVPDTADFSGVQVGDALFSRSLVLAQRTSAITSPAVPAFIAALQAATR